MDENNVSNMEINNDIKIYNTRPPKRYSINSNKIDKIKVPKKYTFSSNKIEKDSLSEAYSVNIRPFIDVIDKLRRFGLQQDINLPNVVVVGDQSSGKSSIIEAISGIQLPRGNGIVTRCPLELQLKRVVDKPWKAVLKYENNDGKEEEIITDDPFTVENDIRQAQTKICGKMKNVSKSLITLRVESPAETAPDLTLIDLPGIARIALDDQPKDICDQIKSIIMDHIRNENTVILCVISANLDAAVNESIKFAKEVDEEGTRTLGVITKPDIAEDAHKEDVLGLLNNEKIKLVKGFHMVKCRSQKQLEEGLSLKDSLENEKIFFENDIFYRDAPSTQIGIMNLAKRITDELVGVIRATLPVLKEEIDKSLLDSEEKLSKLPKPVPECEQHKLMHLFEIISNMNQEIKSSLIHGKGTLPSTNYFYNWRNAFDNMRTRIDKLKNESVFLTSENLKEKILLNRGNEISGFLNFQLFVDIIQKHVMTYKEEALILLKEIKNDAIGILNRIIHVYCQHLPSIETSLKQIVNIQVEKFTKKSSKRINIIFEGEKLIFTMDSTFEKEMEDIFRKQENENRTQPQQLNLYGKNYNSGNNLFYPSGLSLSVYLKNNSERMQEIINIYLKIVHARLMDLIPISIRQCLHVELSESLKEKLSEFVTTPNLKIIETGIFLNERKKLLNKMNRLKNACDELSKI